MTRLYAEIGAALLLVAAFALYTHHERGVGVAQCQADIKTALDAQTALNQTQHEADIKTVTHIGDTYDNATQAPLAAPAPRVRVCNNQVRASSVPEAGAAPSVDHAEASSREADTVDIGTPLVTIGRDADAQVTALQDYVTGVCLK
jgi:hypothetical protein